MKPIAAVTLLALLSASAAAQSIWTGSGADNKWSTAGNWEVAPVFPAALTFAGSKGLANNNDLSGVTLSGLTFDAGAGSFVLSGNAITLDGPLGFSAATPAAPVTQTVNLDMTWTGDQSVSVPTNATLSLGGAISAANNTLVKTGNGTLALGGSDAFAGMVINGGTNIIIGNVTVNATGNNRFYLADANAAFTGTLILQPGANLTVEGTFGDAGVVGRDGGSGAVIQNGGTFSYNPANQNYLFVGASSSTATHAEYHLNSGTLDLNNHILGIALGAGVTITGVVDQVGGTLNNVSQLAVGVLNLGPGHGIYKLSGGTINIGSGGIASDSGHYEVYLGGGTVGASASWASSLNLTLTGANGPVTFNPAGNLITLSGVLSGAGGLTVAGSGTLELSGVNSYTGDTTVNSGCTLQLDQSGSSVGALRLANGARLNLNYSGTYAVAHFYTNGVALPAGTYTAGNLSGFIDGYGELKVASSISTGLWTGSGADSNWSTSGNWDQNAVPVFPIDLTFAGTKRLVNNNDLQGVTASSIRFDAAAGPFVLNGNDLTVNGAIGFNGTPAAPVTQTLNLNQNWNAAKTIDTPTNANLAFGGNVTAWGGLLKTGDGTLTLGGNDSFTGLIINGGTNVITGTTTVNGGGSADRFFLGDANTAYNGTLVIQPGATLTVSGYFGDAGVIGRDGGSGAILQNGGTFTFSPGDHGYLFIGASSRPGTRSQYDMNGGVLDLSGNTLGIALGDSGVVVTGVVNQVGGTIANVGNLQLGSVRPNGYGVYTLSGGSITIGTGGITTSSGTYALNLGGGTVAASASWSSPLNLNLTNLNGSVTFDTAGNTILLSGALSGNGGLTVTGGGTLELSGVTTYTGDTIINAGSTLQLDAAGTSPSALRVASGGLLNLNYTGTYTVSHLYVNGVAKPNGIYNASNLPGVIVGSGELQVAGLVFTVQPQDQVVYLNGNYHQTVTLTSEVTGGSAAFQWYFNGTPMPGATGSSLTLADLQITNAGNFYVVATANASATTSRVATVTIYALNNLALAYDGFDYPAATGVDGTSQNGGFGWSGPWQQIDGNGVLITAGSLAGEANVPPGFDSRAIGNGIDVPSMAQTRSGRYFDCSVTGALAKRGFIDANGNIGANGKTIYLSFLQQADRTSGFYELELHRGSLSDPGRIGGIGNDAAGNNVNLRAPNGVRDRSLGAGTTGVNFYVVRIDFKAGNDDIFVYRNPTTLTEPATPTLTVSNVADMSFNGVSVAAYNGPDVKTDEVRLGATWADALGLAVSNLLPPTKTASGWKMQFAVTPGHTYRIQRATSVTGPWTVIATVTGPENGFVEYEDASAPAGQAFYRTITP